MPRLKHKLPSYCRHKASGQAVVTIDGRDVYLGPYGSDESKQKYEQQIARWLANRETPTLSASSDSVPRDDLRISELLVAYFEHADAYYVKNGAPTGEIKNLEDAVRPLRELFEDERVVDFGPVSLKTVRQAMLSAKLSRRVINARVNRIRRVFKWGVENELVGPEILHALQAVAPLKKGRSSAPERREVQPVPQQHIDAVRALVSSPVRAMIDLQLLTGNLAETPVVETERAVVTQLEPQPAAQGSESDRCWMRPAVPGVFPAPSAGIEEILESCVRLVRLAPEEFLIGPCQILHGQTSFQRKPSDLASLASRSPLLEAVSESRTGPSRSRRQCIRRVMATRDTRVAYRRLRT